VRAAVIGAGVAGLACACELADAGVQTDVYEARPYLGGRASSRADGAGGVIDNCQHVILGCCDRAIEFLSTIGSARLVCWRDEIAMIDSDGAEFRLRPSPLPAPLGYVLSVAATDYLTTREKLALCRVLAGMAVRRPSRSVVAAAYLKSLSCPSQIVERVLEPLVVSALNEPSSCASAHYARMVIRRSIMGSRGAAKLGVLRAPLSTAIGDACERFIADRGGRVFRRARVAALDVSGARVRSAALADGREISADVYIAAVTPDALSRMGVPAAVASLHWMPIVSVHLFHEGAPPVSPPSCVVGEPFGWVFNKSSDFGLSHSCVQAVASAPGDLAKMPGEGLLALARRAVDRCVPELRGRRLERWVLSRDMRATVSTSGPRDASRPGPKTPCANLFIAGDWTDTGWPSTIEGAVRSGTAAARAALALKG